MIVNLSGMMSLLSNIRPNNDLGHPMCANLRDGNWMIGSYIHCTKLWLNFNYYLILDYIWRRLKFDEGTKDLGEWFEHKSSCLKEIPRYLIPCYFDVIVTGMYLQLVEHSFALMSRSVLYKCNEISCAVIVIRRFTLWIVFQISGSFTLKKIIFLFRLVFIIPIGVIFWWSRPFSFST